MICWGVFDLKEMGGAPRNPAPRNHFWNLKLLKLWKLTVPVGRAQAASGPLAKLRQLAVCSRSTICTIYLSISLSLYLSLSLSLYIYIHTCTRTHVGILFRLQRPALYLHTHACVVREQLAPRVGRPAPLLQPPEVSLKQQTKTTTTTTTTNNNNNDNNIVFMHV